MDIAAERAARLSIGIKIADRSTCFLHPEECQRQVCTGSSLAQILVLTSPSVDLCPLLKSFLASRSIKCDSVTDTFTKPSVLSERFAATSTYQYYHLASIDQYIGVNLLARLCDSKPPALHACKDQVQELENASYIDVDFDAISHALVFTAFWNSHRQQILPAQRDKRPIKRLRAEDTIEVGVLQSEQATEPEELSLGGYLTVIGQNDHPGTN
jgi:hypothetical protein